METAALANIALLPFSCSPFGGIPRNWKRSVPRAAPCRSPMPSSPFGGIPRNWKLHQQCVSVHNPHNLPVPPSGGSLEIGNDFEADGNAIRAELRSPFGGIPRNWKLPKSTNRWKHRPDGSPFGGIPRNWKQLSLDGELLLQQCSPFGGIPRNWKLCMTSLKRSASVLFPLRGDP